MPQMVVVAAVGLQVTAQGVAAAALVPASSTVGLAGQGTPQVASAAAAAVAETMAAAAGAIPAVGKQRGALPIVQGP